MNDKPTAAVTPISSHARFERKTAVTPWKETVTPWHDETVPKTVPAAMSPRLASNPDYVLDMDSVAATQSIRLCAWIIAHRHSKQDALDVLQMAMDDIKSGFKP